MSEPPTTPTPPLRLHSPPILGGATATASSPIIREYRKGNWSIQETLILITAKKLDDERRIKASSTSKAPCRTGELRWKWVENYCWNHGCLRSQNQCNDKWDNLLRDYKKVREYDAKSDNSQDLPSYWKIEKHERKQRNLPSNMSFEVFQALNEVLHTRTSFYLKTSDQAASLAPSPAPVTVPTPAAEHPVASPGVSEGSASSATHSSEKLESDRKRKKVGDIGSSIVHSASVLARTLRSREENKDKRHQEIMELEQRRLEIEETRNDLNRQEISHLVAAFTDLSGAIQSLVSDYRHHT